MIVAKEDLPRVIQILRTKSHISVDVETTGFNAYHGDNLFSLIIGTDDETYYFNFIDYPGLDEKFVLSRPVTFASLDSRVFHDKEKVVFGHNIKFDMHFLAQEGCFIQSKIHDTEVVARLIYNDHPSYKLADCVSRIGLEKSGALEEYLTKDETGKPRYDRVPFHIITTYGIKDGEITYKLGMQQIAELSRLDSLKLSPASIMRPYQTEMAITPILFEMERTGLRVDVEYCKGAMKHDQSRLLQIERDFKALVGSYLVDSAKFLGPLLLAAGDDLGKTEGGNASIADHVLKECSSPIAQLVRDHREYTKRVSTYWKNFIDYSDKDGTVRASYGQNRARTGRMSCQSPNLQNVPKSEEGSDFPIRRAIIPLEGFELLEIDYKAQEFRLAVDYADEGELAAQIQSGFDPHQATAELTGLPRSAAKSMNFGLLYGIGKVKLGKMLGVSPEEAALMKARYFSKLPGVKWFIKRAGDIAAQRKYVFNWAGRMYHYPESKWAYKAANAIIQGGCADIVKEAMIRVSKYLKDENLNTKMVAQVHDSLLFQLDPKEKGHIPVIQMLMAQAYPHKILPMDTSVAFSTSSWGDMG